MTLRETIARAICTSEELDWDAQSDPMTSGGGDYEQERFFAAADAILSLPEIAKIREALEPFAAAADALPSWASVAHTLAAYPGFCASLDVAALRAACEALSLLKESDHVQ